MLRKNPHIKFGKNEGFTLATPKQEESDAEPLQHFFPERSYVRRSWRYSLPSTATLTTWTNCSTGSSAITTVGPQNPRFCCGDRDRLHDRPPQDDATDTFGFSELVFGVSHLLSFSYAPRFENLKRQRLYIFKSRRG